MFKKINKTYNIFLHNIRELIRKIKSNKSNQYRLRFVLFTSLILFIGSLGVYLIKDSYAKYESKKNLVTDTVAALYIIKPGSYSFDMSIEGVVPGTDDYVYSFTVSNYEESSLSNVDLSYSMKIITTTNLPLNYRLYKNELPSGGTNLLNVTDISQDTESAWYKVFDLDDISSLKHDIKTTDTYYLVVNFPQSAQSTITYAGQIESVEVKIDAKQVI